MSYQQQPQYPPQQGQQYQNQQGQQYQPQHGQQYQNQQGPRMNQYQNYPEQSNPPLYSTDPSSVDNLIPKKESRFKAGAYKDVWATALFGLFLAGFVAVSYFGIGHLNDPFGSTNPDSPSQPQINIPTKEVIELVILSAIIGFVLSATYFFLLQRFAGKLIKVSLVVSVATNVVLAVYFFYLKQIVAAIIWLVLAALYAYCFYSWRHRIPFAKVLLKAVTGVTKQFPSVIVVAVGGLLVQFAWVAYWIVTVVGVVKAAQNGTITSTVSYVLYVYTLFTFYWTTQVIANVVFITVSGLFGTYYFKGVASPDGNVHVPVANPTAASLKRALTTSLGPNCYGSLLIAIIQTIKALADNARNQEGNDNIACTVILCCLSCILGLIEELLEYFNKYAFVQVAVYNKDYCTAAKDTWALAKARGIDALINDNLIGSVLGMGGLFIGLITGGIALLFSHFSPAIPSEPAYLISIGLAGFIIGIVEFSVLSNVIDAGVTTTFVCLAEDPAALAQTKPILYNKIRETYPAIHF